jgi:hypothetical protein
MALLSVDIMNIEKPEFSKLSKGKVYIMDIATRSLRLRLISFAIISVILSCWNVADGNGRPKAPTQLARLGREFQIRARHQVTLKREGLRVEFAAVTEDSRCPADVQCIWAGNATVRLEVSVNGRGSKSLTLNTHRGPSLVDETQYRGYKLKLVQLKPYPRSNRDIAAGDYVATLLVTKT